MTERIRRLAALRPRRVSAAASVILVVLGYLLLAPAACGGPVTYARVAGSSMAPSLQPGDLVFARKAEAYSRGDIVAYHNPDLGLVMHRIIVDNRDRVIVKGDANSWVDSYQPRKSEIAGKLWLHVPHGATLLAWMRPPWATLAFTALAMLVFALPLLRRRGLRGLRGGARQYWNEQPGWNTARIRLFWHEHVAPALTVYTPAGSIVALASIVVAGIALFVTSMAYGREPLRVTPEEHAFTQRASFRYEAHAPAGLYDGPTIHEGDPVFLRLTRAVQMAVDLDVEGDRVEHPSGTIALSATLRQQNGWERTMVLAPERRFTGAHASAQGTLDLGAFRRMVEDAEAASGVHFESYQLVVGATVRTTVGESAPLRPFDPQVVFRISANQLQIEQTVSGERSPLHHVSNTALQGSRTEVDRLSLGPWSPTVAAARFWAPIALLGAAVVLVALGRTTMAALGGDEAERIEAQYAGLVLRAHMLQPPPDLTLVQMQSFEDLARMARTAGLPVLRRSDSPPDYILLTPEAAYHYEANDRERPSAITARIARRLRGQAA